MPGTDHGADAGAAHRKQEADTSGVGKHDSPRHDTAGRCQLREDMRSQLSSRSNRGDNRIRIRDRHILPHPAGADDDAVAAA